MLPLTAMVIDEREKLLIWSDKSTVEPNGSIVIEMYECHESEGVKFGCTAHGYDLYEQRHGQIDHLHMLMLVLGYVEPTYI